MPGCRPSGGAETAPSRVHLPTARSVIAVRLPVRRSTSTRSTPPSQHSPMGPDRRVPLDRRNGPCYRDRSWNVESRRMTEVGRSVVVFDVGGGLIDWDPRHLYRKLF